MEQEKYALALGSGGEKGFVHIGILKALEDLEIEITHIGGTSVGSFVGGLYSLWKDARRIEELALNIDRRELLDLFSGYMQERATGKKDSLLFYIENYFHNEIFQDCVIPFVAVSVDLYSGEKIFHKEGLLKHAIRASCSIPYLFGAYDYDNKLHIDGGYADSIPIDAVKDIGGENTIGVNLQSYIPLNSKKKSILNIHSATYKATLYNFAKENMKSAEKKLTFNIEEYSIKEILNDRHRFIDLGYNETMRMFNDPS